MHFSEYIVASLTARLHALSPKSAPAHLGKLGGSCPRGSGARLHLCLTVTLYAVTHLRQSVSLIVPLMKTTKNHCCLAVPSTPLMDCIDN